MEKKKVAIVTLGDSRREFYKKRETIVASEIEKVKKAFTEMHKYSEQRYTPKVKISKRCNACSLKDICVPVLNKRKSVSTYIDKMLSEKENE